MSRSFMPLRRWYSLFGLVCWGAGLLAAHPGRAQVPPLLLGRWELRQISFIANQTVPPDILERMDNPEVAELNQEVAAGAAHLVVEFRPDGTYHFTVMRAGQPARTEQGAYRVSGKTLLAQSPGTEGGSSFDRQQLVEVSRRRLVVRFLVGDELPGVAEELAYRRVP
ncbi:hypothetical protein [Hymenobacter cheonanensis]|uniref:hypothetical protein n=1 Tax=Hymenobacter sp. CA2-7 TaxID=3063993 RepID=UPI0027135C2D|nr:hypothetical protein [Hymenobacter sp. CA2-7]MDO7885920.1 hypothetical protein [Hymenobacter sp. CA2-7]